MQSQDPVFDAIEQNLMIGGLLVQSVTDQQFCDSSVPPYHSSIGCHMRHVLDIFQCIIRGLDAGSVDLSARERCLDIEQSRTVCLSCLDSTLHQINALRGSDLSRLLDVTDDLGCGPVTCRYTIGAALCQAHSHAIHHFAALGYMTTQLGVSMPGSGFGYNPTTPREAIAS